MIQVACRNQGTRLRTGGRGSELGHSVNHPGIEDQVPKIKNIILRLRVRRRTPRLFPLKDL